MSVFSGPISRRVLIVSLIVLAGVYLLWFGATPSPWAALLVFALPPAALAMAALRGARHAAFWAGVCALGWFAHGVMIAYTRAPERLFATAEIVLALVVVAAVSAPAMRARFAKRKPPAGQ